MCLSYQYLCYFLLFYLYSKKISTVSLELESNRQKKEYNLMTKHTSNKKVYLNKNFELTEFLAINLRNYKNFKHKSRFVETSKFSKELLFE